MHGCTAVVVQQTEEERRSNTLLLGRSLHALCAPCGLHTKPRALWLPRHKTISYPTACELLLLQCCMPACTA